MSQRSSEYVRKERNDYPTPAWVTETVIPHLMGLNVTSIWEPAAGEGGMAAALTRAGFTVIATDLSGGVNFLDDKAQAVSRCDAIVTNPPYGLQGKLAERFIERALNLTRPNQGAVAMLLKVDFDSGLTRLPVNVVG
jgi:tRNA G10  N-methylase Trm11